MYWIPPKWFICTTVTVIFIIMCYPSLLFEELAQNKIMDYTLQLYFQTAIVYGSMLDIN